VNRQAVTPMQPKSAPLLQGGFLQRKCSCGQHAGGGECEGCKKQQELQRQKAGSGGPAEAPEVVHQVLRSTGQPLDSDTKAFMESRFERDFSRVRVHAGTRAAESARAVNALAYTVGQHVVFGEGQYTPNTTMGRRLMAHELSHVIQQGDVTEKESLQEKLAVSMPGDAAEREADRIADAVASGVSLKAADHMGESTPHTLQRTCADGRCEDCAGGRRDFWVTAFFRRRANTATMTNLRTQIDGAKAILRNCCLDLKFDFNWRLLRGASSFPAGTARPAGDPLGGWDYPADAEALGEGPTFTGARGVPMLVVDDVPGSGGGVTMIRGLDAEYTGLNYFAIAVNQPAPNPNCNHIAHELWHMTGAPGHDPADGPITACTSNAVSLTYCNALRAIVAPKGDFPLPAPATKPGATRMA
jgi:Domain of unknown function (DUF4157)